MDKKQDRASSKHDEKGGSAPIVLHARPCSSSPPASTVIGQGSPVDRATGASCVDIRPFMATFPAGVGVITAREPGGPLRGMTCTSICSVALEPPTLLVCLRRDSLTLGAVLASSGFALNLLHDEARATAEIFASSVPDRFAQVAWHLPSACKGPHLVNDAHSVADCQVVHAETFGDHVIVFGEVLQIAQQREVLPLLYGLRRYIRWPGNEVARIDARSKG